MNAVRMFRKPVIALVAALLLVAGLATTALAFSSGTNVTVSPGARVCLAPQYAYSYVNVQGSASKGARFLVLWGRSPYDVSTEIFRAENVTGTAAQFSTYTHPYNFPGYFRLCVRNTNTTSINASLYQYGN